jgi:phosphatidylserine decarboxylase
VKDALIVSMLSLVPKNHAARWMGKGTRLRLPRFAHRLLLRWFVRTYKVDLSECVGGIDDFESLAHFFVRPLKEGVRPVDASPGVLVSPVDGRAHTFGEIVDGCFLQAEGKPCPVSALLGEDLAPSFEGGSYAVLYLAPPDYHRVHSPLDGSITALDYHPGQLWPVFAAATRKVKNLFARNERLVFDLQTPAGRCALVMVGAFGVGRMTNILDDGHTNSCTVSTLRPIEPPRPITRGGEIGRFELGSTVILLFEPGRVQWQMSPGQTLRLGRTIGVLTGQ